MTQIKTMQLALRQFAAAREWDQFHKPKNLVIALAAEMGELLEHFQWLNDDQIEKSKNDKTKREQISDEFADVFSYLIRLADKMEIDIEAAFRDKLAKNELKYPVEKSKGSAKKYTEY